MAMSCACTALPLRPATRFSSSTARPDPGISSNRPGRGRTVLDRPGNGSRPPPQRRRRLVSGVVPPGGVVGTLGGSGRRGRRAQPGRRGSSRAASLTRPCNTVTRAGGRTGRLRSRLGGSTSGTSGYRSSSGTASVIEGAACMRAPEVSAGALTPNRARRVVGSARGSRGTADVLHRKAPDNSRTATSPQCRQTPGELQFIFGAALERVVRLRV